VPSLRPSKTHALIAALLAAFLLLGACGGGSDNSDEDAKTDSGKAPGGGSADHIVLWANESQRSLVEAIVTKFNKRYPDVDVEIVTGRGRELTDRLLQGETPDLFLSTANDLSKLAREGSFPDEQVEVGRDPMQIIVPAGNPGRVADGDLEVFGFDPSTTTGLCAADAACGRAARALLANARINPTPDVTTATTSELVSKLASGQLDAGLLYRSEATKPRIKGTVEAVPIPSTLNVETVYQIGTGRHGPAADQFVEFVRKGESLEKILQQAGLAPLEGDPQ
jgi:molybdate transport system substrate-binding protein